MMNCPTRTIGHVKTAPLLHGLWFSCILADGDPTFCAYYRFQAALVVSQL